jgi:hypothetical protein
MSNILQSKVNAKDWHQLRQNKLKGSVDALLHTEALLTPQEQADLYAAGFSIHYVMKSVLSGQVFDITRLEEIAQLPFVTKIELSQPMLEESL